MLQNTFSHSLISNLHGRITVDEALFLYTTRPLAELGRMADTIRRHLHDDKVYFIENYHIEPTNICQKRCKFCSFYALEDSQKSWRKNIEQILDEVSHLSPSIRELHVVGGAHPDYNLDFYQTLFSEIKKLRPDIHLKALTATEITFLAELHHMTVQEVLSRLKDKGLDSLPGGGAEILDDNVRKQICPHKLSSSQWLEVHRTAHKLGIPSNATILYGHIETLQQRFQHLEKIRQLQDETGMFRAFIPLKFHPFNNELSSIKPSSILDDLRMFAICRIYFDNISHLKIYWPAFSKHFASVVLHFGVDDLDGTIDSSTRIYSMAGATEQQPTMAVNEAVGLISQSGFRPMLRDADYRILQMIT